MYFTHCALPVMLSTKEIPLLLHKWGYQGKLLVKRHAFTLQLEE